INQRLNGVSFLGARIFPHHLRIKQPCFRRTLKGMKQKTMAYNSGAIDESSYTASLCSVMGHLDFFNSYRLRCKTGQANNWF
ncbi:hypothetical protein KKA14_16420, partial [bacterium]|nr:hypothetical protein [bacterium]